MLESSAGHSGRFARLASAALFLALPLFVWYIGSFYFHGDLGKWLDDYGAHVRDPVSGSFEWSKLLRYQWWFFWRPIHVHLVFALQTLCWNHDWLNHLFSALMHALACGALWRFLRACGLHAVVSSGAALIMLGSVQGFEAIHWPATVSTSIATTLFLVAATIAIRHAQGLRGRWTIVFLGVLGFLTPCLYEQPAAALAALPLLYLAMMARSDGAARESTIARAWISRVPRTLIVFLPCVIGISAYLVLYVISVRQHPMARESRFISLANFWPHAKYTLWATGIMLDPVRGLDEVRTLGLAAIRASGFGGVVVGLLAAAAGTLWVAAWARGEDHQVLRTNASRRFFIAPHLALASFACIAFFLALFPIAAIGGAGPTPRLAYFPLVCIIIAAAAFLDWLLSRMSNIGWRRNLSNATIAGASAALALAGCLHLVGVQAAMREVHRRDVADMSNLRAALPSPAPGTIFVPVRVLPPSGVPSSDRLRNSFQSIWCSPWAVNTYIKHIYAREDVNASALYVSNQSNAIVRLGEPTLISWSHYIWHLPQPRVDNSVCPPFPTSLIVPLTIDADGQLSLVSELRARAPDGSEVPVAFAQAKRAVGKSISHAIALPVDSGRPWLNDWRWPHRDGAEVKFLRVPSWGASERAVRMHPATPGTTISDGDSDEMTLHLKPSSIVRSFVFYATFDEQTIDLSTKGDGVDLVWSLDAEPGAALPASVLFSTALDPKLTRDRRTWQTATIEIPPQDRPRTLRLTVGAGKANNPSYDRILITCGEDATHTPTSATASPAGKAND